MLNISGYTQYGDENCPVKHREKKLNALCYVMSSSLCRPIIEYERARMISKAHISIMLS